MCVHGLYPFAMGTELHNGYIPVFRLGGHRLEHENGWQCAVREVYEETNLQINPLTPSTTYLLPDGDCTDAELEKIQWQHETEQEPGKKDLPSPKYGTRLCLRLRRGGNEWAGRHSSDHAGSGKSARLHHRCPPPLRRDRCMGQRCTSHLSATKGDGLRPDANAGAPSMPAFLAHRLAPVNRYSGSPTTRGALPSNEKPFGNRQHQPCGQGGRHTEGQQSSTDLISLP